MTTLFHIKFHTPITGPFHQLIQSLLESLPLYLCFHYLAQLGIVRKFSYYVDELHRQVNIVYVNNKQDRS